MKPLRNKDKIEYYVRLRGIFVCHSYMYCHGYIKATKRDIFGTYYIVKNAKDERVDVVRPCRVLGRV